MKVVGVFASLGGRQRPLQYTVSAGAADVSLCMIVRNEEEVLARCLDSVRQHVKEICIVDTGSTDRTIEIAKSFGARVESFVDDNSFFVDSEEECRKIGAPPPYSGATVLGDFARARNQSFAMATCPFRMWLDADDVVVRPENIALVVRNLVGRKQDAAVIPYWTEMGADGTPVQTIWRERIVRAGAATWQGAVHETMSIYGTEYAVFHVEQKRPARSEPRVVHRNLKLMLREHHLGRRDERLSFYLGHACKEVGDWLVVNKAEPTWITRVRRMEREFFEQHLAVGNWNAQRAKAHRFLGDSWFNEGTAKTDPHAKQRTLVRALAEYAASVVEMPENPDGFFGLARVSYFMERWADVVRYTEAAFELGNPALPPWTDLHEREGWPHIYYNFALWKLGRHDEAIASCADGLKALPDNAWLRDNLKWLTEWKVSHSATSP